MIKLAVIVDGIPQIYSFNSKIGMRQFEKFILSELGDDVIISRPIYDESE